MTVYPIERFRTEGRSRMTKAQFIKELLALRNEAVRLDMHRVTICLDYAHWEVVSTERPPDPLAPESTEEPAPEYY